MTKRIIILTGNELRHRFFKTKIASTEGIEVLKTYCESEENLLHKSADQHTYQLRQQHLVAREQSEIDFFDLYVNASPDCTNSVVIKRGEINDEKYFKEIVSLQPELIIVYGASIIKDPLLSFFDRKILNVHLGLSPYYRGAATNFWPLVDQLPECVGATFMFIDSGIDTGEIIHQERADYTYYDTPSTIGNRMIKKMTNTFSKIILLFDQLRDMPAVAGNGYSRVCKKKDYTEEAVQKVYSNFNNGMIKKYLNEISERNNRFPIVVNPIVS